jgi:hypothetical protein
MGLVVSGVWLHPVSPQQNAFDRALRTVTRFRDLAGAPRDKLVDHRALHHRGMHSGGHRLVTTVDPDTICFTIGVLLLAYSLYSRSAGLQTAQGELSGGSWCRRHQWPDRRLDWAWRRCGDCLRQLRGGKGRAARGLSAGAFATFVMTTISFAIAGTFTIETLKLMRSPPGTRCRHLVGFRALRKARRCRFRKVILVLLLRRAWR